MDESAKKSIIASMAFFVFMPYHIIYAVTIWKDIIFGCFVLLFVIFIYRCLYDLGNKNLNYGMLATASMIICLFRSNSLFVFVIITLAFVLFWKFKYKRILVILVSAVVLSFIMKHSVLEWFEVAQPDLIESLSIPAQQIARVVAERCILTDWETEMLSKIIDIDQIPSAYLDYISDPIKQLVREKGNQQLLADNAKDYMKLYLSLGLKHPTVYLRAWIDETRGYWNAGYEYWRWGVGVSDNNLGIVRTIRSIVLARCFEEYLWLFTDVQGLRLFLSIGLFIWIDIVLLMVALLRKDKVGAFVSLPIIIIVESLLVATPVFSEFRYIYAAFCALPMVIVIVLRPIELEMG